MCNAEKYRGKQIALTGNISFVIFASDSFQDDKGKIFELYVYETGDGKKIFISENLTDIPKAVFPDRVVEHSSAKMEIRNMVTWRFI